MICDSISMKTISKSKIREIEEKTFLWIQKIPQLLEDLVSKDNLPGKKRYRNLGRTSNPC